ncbi:MAG: hypothetical protein PHE68_04960 [Candidatus Peribacteraceae bacterium]|nr:hypothetical protein [Candidatus Peribacteraceae bacterium]MDD5075034.1 hypothetical protein [Candidatus Peribacteraceae bacterium]
MYWIVRLFFLRQALIAFAQDTASFIPQDGGGCDIATGDIQADCIPGFIANIIKTIFGFTGGIFLVLVMISGFRIMIGKATGGDSSSGYTMLRFAIIGFITSALTFFIIDFFISTIAGA